MHARDVVSDMGGEELLDRLSQEKDGFNTEEEATWVFVDAFAIPTCLSVPSAPGGSTTSNEVQQQGHLHFKGAFNGHVFNITNEHLALFFQGYIFCSRGTRGPIDCLYGLLHTAPTQLALGPLLQSGYGTNNTSFSLK